MATATLPPAPLTYDTWRRLLAGVPLPAAVVDLDAFDRNVARVSAILRASGQAHTLRLATKSLRVPALIARVLAAGPPYAGLMCFAAAEAEFLARQGHDDLLIAYPTVQESDLAALARLHGEGRLIRLVIDSRAAAERVAAAMRGLARPFPLVLDVDLSLRLAGGRLHLGVRRSPLRSTEGALALWEHVERLPGVRPVGFMGYEAQVAGLGDRNVFKRLVNPVAGWIRRRSVAEMAVRRAELVEACRRRGWSLEVFNGGGTGSVNWAASEAGLTEVTVGSAFLCSHLFDYYSNVAFEPAAFFALQLTRSSDPGYVTCQGGGYIASGEPGWDKTPRPWLPAGLRLVSTEGCGEVQTPLIVPPEVRLDLGDPVLFRHAKAGELAERFTHYHPVAGGELEEPLATYRGLGQSFG